MGGGGNNSATAVAIDDLGYAYVTGVTSAIDFPTVNAFQNSLSVGPVARATDVFIAKLDRYATRLVYSTYLGGTSSDGAQGIAVDSAGSAYVTGYTLSQRVMTIPDREEA